MADETTGCQTNTFACDIEASCMKKHIHDAKFPAGFILRLRLVSEMQGSLQPAQQEECNMDRMTEAGIAYIRR